MPAWLERFLESLFGPSWRTALAGLAAFLTVCYTPVRAFLDGDASTIPDWNPVMAAVFAFLGFAKARDNVVTSQQVQGSPPGQLK